jgi:hypothetical protein
MNGEFQGVMISVHWMLELPGHWTVVSQHDQCFVSGEVLRRKRHTVALDVAGRGEQKPRRRCQRALNQGRV